MLSRVRILVLMLVCLLGANGLPRLRAAPPVEAQPSEYIVDVWDIQDGLPHSTVTGIVQSPDGYLWCSTHDGVVRFDGVRFLRIGPDDRANLMANHVLCVHVDRQNRLWVGTDGAGLLRYTNGTFTGMLEHTRPMTNSVFAITEDAAGTLWLGTRDGLARLDHGQTTWLTRGNGYANAPNIARSLAFDRDGGLWVTDSTSLKLWRDGGFTTVNVRAESKLQRLWAVGHDGAGHTWAGSVDSKIWQLRDGKWHSEEGIGALPYPDPVIFREARSGDFWVGTRKGLFRRRHGEWKMFGREDGLLSPDVRAIFEDREGNVWVGTSGGGLARFKHRLLTTYGARDGLTDERVQGLCEKPGGGLWVGLGRGGLFEREHGAFQRSEAARGLPTDLPITSLLTQPDGALWVGTFGNQLWRVANGAATLIDAVPSYRATAESITALLTDRAGDLWVGTYLGLRKVADKKLVPVLTGDRYLRSHVTSILDAAGGGVWVGYHGLGLVRMHGDKAEWITRKEGLPTDFVRTLHEDRGGTLWIGTAAGLCRRQEGVVHTFTRAQGLADDTISQILEDDAENLWLGSNQGIMRIRKSDLDAVARGRSSSLEVFVCGRGEGMQSLECSGGFHPAGLKSRDGRLWFPTAKGLVMVDPSQMNRETNPTPPPVYLEEVRADGRSVWQAPVQGGNPAAQPLVELPAGPQRLEFKYTALSFTSPERVRFKHRLVGFDSAWSDADGGRSAVYAKLGPGQYQFQVMACNHDGVWNEAGAAMAFTVPPFFWQTWWFNSLAAAAGFALLGGTVRYFEKKKLQRKLERLERQQAVERERARIARDIHDDLGASLTRITLLSQSMRDGENGDVNRDIDQVYSIARDLTRSMDEIVWAVNPQHDTLDSVVTYLGKFAQDFLRAASVRCRLDLPVQLPAWPITSEVRHGLFLAFKEALHNAVKHAGASEVRVRLVIDEGGFTLCVEDDGRGFDPAQAREATPNGSPDRITTGHGLKNLQQRLQEIGGRCEIESRPATGTTVKFVITTPNAATKAMS
jgi:signal transduction histidine kinase/ligand-binding sensor domain-containing protein